MLRPRRPVGDRGRIGAAAVMVAAALCSGELACSPAGAATTAAVKRVTLTDPIEKCIVGTYRLVGREGNPAEDVHCYFALPQDEPGQQVLELRFVPEPKEVLTDRHGRRLAHFVVPRIAPGRHVPVRWIARARLWATKTSVAASLASPRHKITPAIRKLYLADSPRYGVGSAYIRKLAASIAPASKPPVQRVRAINRYMRRNLRYVRDARWDKAEVVLRRGVGSCSEYTYAFIALCRAAGVPARYIGATQCTRARGAFLDRPHHRWGETFIEGHGWVPVDVLMRKCVGTDYFYIANHFLVLGHGDGGSDNPLGWRYTAASTAKVAPIASREFYWCDGVSAAELDAVLAAGARTPAEAGKALAKLNRQLCIPFLTDVLLAGDAVAAAHAARVLCDLDVGCARDLRYTWRRIPNVRTELTAALEAKSLAGATRPPGAWVDLFNGKRFLADRREFGPFAVRDGLLRNDNGRGVAWSSYTTTDCCVIDLLFAHVGNGRVALAFAGHGEKLSLRLPFRSTDPNQRKFNRLIPTTCKRGLYGVAPRRWHRATVAVDGYTVRFDLDGKTVFTHRGRKVGPGRVALNVWGEKDRFLVRRLRVLPVPKGRPIAELLADKKLMALDGWPPKPGHAAPKLD